MNLGFRFFLRGLPVASSLHRDVGEGWWEGERKKEDLE